MPLRRRWQSGRCENIGRSIYGRWCRGLAPEGAVLIKKKASGEGSLTPLHNLGQRREFDRGASMIFTAYCP